MKIEGKLTGAIDTKRFRLPGLKITVPCYHCAKELVFNGDSDYISYPKFNEPSLLHFYCESCNGETLAKVKLNVSVEKA